MGSETKGYYDIEIDIGQTLIDGGMVDEIFYLQDLKQRKLFLNAEIDQISIADIAKHILQYNKEDRGKAVDTRQPIL